MSNMSEYAKSELELAFPHNTNDEIQVFLIKNIMELIQVFSKQGHSNHTAPYVLRYFNRLAMFKPIKPLTGEEDEWGEPYGENHTQQNKRGSQVFRNHFDNSTAYDIEGRIFIDENGWAYTTADSRVPVTFPYNIPDRPEYVKVSLQAEDDSE